MGHDAVHVLDIGLEAAEDASILEWAADEQRVVITADMDFGALLAANRGTMPSVILFRRGPERRAEMQASLLGSHLVDFTADLELGAIVVIEELRIRVRRLPIGRG
jgi:predicted nuclease of predicted toxin-antitoxin system